MDAVATGVDDDRTRRSVAAIAAVMGLLGVLIGAFGAHGLDVHLTNQFSLSPELLAKRLDQFDVGARYHLVHAVALLAICGLPSLSGLMLRIAAGLMIGGIVLFSGSLYVLVATNTPWLGAVTPIGGVSWIVGWTVVAVGAIRAPQRGARNIDL